MRILLLHHSVGRYLIRDGDLRSRLALGDPPLELWDHDYNKFGLTTATGEKTVAFPIPGDDTDPPGLLRLFAGDDAEARAAREQALAFDVIAMKSCYPNSGIADEADLEVMMATYRDLLAALAGIGRRQFVLLTSPPLAPLRTNSAQGRRARSVAAWLAGPAAADIPNVRVFDLFDRLAEPPGADQSDRLRKIYRRRLPFDSHPNIRAGRDVGPEMIATLQEAARAAREPGAVSAA
jgi:nucleotide-binding universal stress UspA family protein